MLEHFKGDEEFVSKILDYKDQALYSQRMILTQFLDPHQQSIVESVIGHELKVEADGGLMGQKTKEYSSRLISMNLNLKTLKSQYFK